MLVANTFDLWRKDTFFSAAEEVQESADIMQSAYRTWVRERRERPSLEYLDELSRELQAALGTAKWQLEEFERAVRLSYRHRRDDSSTTRHRQFIDAIANQIFQIEAALEESFTEEGRKPLRWVNLDEEERDDLAAFLSGTPNVVEISKDKSLGTSLSNKSTNKIHIKRTGIYLKSNAAWNWENFDETKCSKDVIIIDRDVNCTIDIVEQENPRSLDGINCKVEKTTNTKPMWSLPGCGALKIVIADEDEQRNKLLSAYKDTPKVKGSKLFLWRQKCWEFSQANMATNFFHQLFCQVLELLHNIPLNVKQDANGTRHCPGAWEQGKPFLRTQKS